MIWSTVFLQKLVILGYFLPFYPHKNPKNQNFAKWKNLLEISSLYTCPPKITIIWCNSWDTEWDRQNLLSFLAIVLPLSPLTTRKIKILKLKKIPGPIMILHNYTINDSHMTYGSWDMERSRQNFLSFWTIFCPFNP